MWADNETDEDLLGLDFVIDPLVVALTEPRLLPLTAGLLGDWGSGKTSVLKIVRAELEDQDHLDEADQVDGRFVCVEFSPWRYEGYEDIKVALMSAVLDRLRSEAGDAEQRERLSWLRRQAFRFRRHGRALGRVALTAAPQAVPVVAGLEPLVTPEVVEAARVVVGSVAAVAQQALQAPTTTDGSATASGADPDLEVDAFRREFEALVASLTGVKAVIVLIDDMDRCLPESVVDTFEAVRLFLNSPKTAFVVAANQHVVESAIDSRYPELRRPDGTGIGADYLEKMLQIQVAIPALSAAEVETYMNLLLAELHLADRFAEVLDAVRARRATNPLGVAFNLGIAEELLGADAIPDALVKDLEWATHLAPALAGGLRGNPRQLKRFLNNVVLRSRSARRRRVVLDQAVVAKLLVLEEQHFTDFKKLFDWQMEAPGPVPQLALAEKSVKHTSRHNGAEPEPAADPGTVPKGRGSRTTGSPDGQGDPAESLSSDVTEWIGRQHIRSWLSLEPQLAGVDLRPYFTYSRHKLSLGVVVSRLAPRLQELLANMQADIDATRRAALEGLKGLDIEERDQVVAALLENLARQPGGPAFVAAVEMADRLPETVQAVCEAMMKLPVSAVPAPRATTAVRRLPREHPAAVALLDRWQHSGVPALEGMVTAARQAAARGGR
jgi:hypothetical protein